MYNAVRFPGGALLNRCCLLLVVVLLTSCGKPVPTTPAIDCGNGVLPSSFGTKSSAYPDGPTRAKPVLSQPATSSLDATRLTSMKACLDLEKTRLETEKLSIDITAANAATERPTFGMQLTPSGAELYMRVTELGQAKISGTSKSII